MLCGCAERGVGQTERNLRRVHPDASEADIRDLSRAGMRSYLRYWCEAFRPPTWPRERITDTFILGRQEILDSALESGGALMIPHTWPTGITPARGRPPPTDR